MDSSPPLYAVNRIIHFAVPVFLFLTCLLLARSFLKTKDLGSYAKNRAHKNLLPYVVISVFFTVFHLLAEGTALSPRATTEQIVADIFTGKASFHLYFTLVSLQAAFFVPIAASKLSLARLSFPSVLLLATFLQVIVFWLQRSIFHFERPGSTLLWYVLPFTLGIYFADKEKESELSQSGRFIAALTILSGISYVAASTFPLLGRQTSSDWINISFALYSIGIAITLWRFREDFPKGRIRRITAFLGRISLPLFLVHPLVMYYLGGPKITNILSGHPSGFVVYLVGTFGLSIAIAKLLLRIPAARFLLGESWSIPKAA